MLFKELTKREGKEKPRKTLWSHGVNVLLGTSLDTNVVPKARLELARPWATTPSR